MEQLKAFLQITFYNNTIARYFSVLLIFLIAVFAIKIVDKFVLRRLETKAKKTKGILDDLIIIFFRKSIPMFYIVVLYVSISALTLSDSMKVICLTSLKVIVVLYVVYILLNAIDLVAGQYIKKKDVSVTGRSVKGISKFAKFIVYVFGFLLLLNNLNINISTLLTGLGIGGIAVALAVQSILGDLFSYFTIVLDKPFEEGDYIAFSDFSGTVERIGLKSTRVKSLSGEEIVVSNAELTGTSVRNYRKMIQRRVVFRIGVVYETPLVLLKEIPIIIKSIIDKIENATFDRAPFISFGDFSLNFEIVYYVSDRDYLKYVNIQHEINLKIIEEFGKRGISFAYPTQVIYKGKNNDK